MLIRRLTTIVPAEGVILERVDPAHRSGGHAEELADRLLDQAARDGALLALLCSEDSQEPLELHDFETVSIADVELAVTGSSRRGAPMTLSRSSRI